MLRQWHKANFQESLSSKSTIPKNIRDHSPLNSKQLCLESVQIRSFFWSEYRKIRTRISSVFEHFWRSAIFLFIAKFPSILQKILDDIQKQSPGEKLSVQSFFCSAFSRIWTEYGDLLSKFLYSVKMQENTNQKNSASGQFSCSCFL